jgi:Holliday junction DNA helicase RuvA
MITSLRGVLISKSPTEVVVEVGGIGYGVHIPLSTFEAIGDPPAEVHLLTHLHVREDAIMLFGFASLQEREMFRMLIGVNGIGPRMAQGILSGIPAEELRQYIAGGNLAALTAIPGVGRKIAERLVIELREKISRLGAGLPQPPSGAHVDTAVREEAMLALASLGYNKSTAERALRTALQELAGGELTVEHLLKTALRHASRQ